VKIWIKLSFDAMEQPIEISVTGSDPLISEILAEAMSLAVTPAVKFAFRSAIPFLADPSGPTRLSLNKRASEVNVRDGSILCLMSSGVLPIESN
jgi:hypothetical protein